MKAARILGTLGKTVIAVGFITLLFGIFQLWGTGVFEAQAQKGLDSEFSDLLETSSALGPAPETAMGPMPHPAPSLEQLHQPQGSRQPSRQQKHPVQPPRPLRRSRWVPHPTPPETPGRPTNPVPNG